MNVNLELSRLGFDVARLIHSTQGLEEAVAYLSRVVGTGVSTPDDAKSDATDEDATPSLGRDIVLFSDIVKNWPKSLPLNDLFVRYFTENCFEASCVQEQIQTRQRQD